jgi:hypothetical protein
MTIQEGSVVRGLLSAAEYENQMNMKIMFRIVDPEYRLPPVNFNLFLIAFFRSPPGPELRARTPTARNKGAL